MERPKKKKKNATITRSPMKLISLSTLCPTSNISLLPATLSSRPKCKQAKSILAVRKSRKIKKNKKSPLKKSNEWVVLKAVGDRLKGWIRWGSRWVSVNEKWMRHFFIVQGQKGPDESEREKRTSKKNTSKTCAKLLGWETQRYVGRLRLRAK